MSSRLTRYVSPTLMRFLVVGGVSYLVNQAALYLLYDRVFAGRHVSHGVDTTLLLASVIAVEISILVRFSLNDAWTFRGRCRKPLVTRFYQFNLSSFGSPLISLAAVNILTPRFGVSYLIANSVGILAGLVWNWLWSQVVWNKDASADIEQSSPLLRTGGATVSAQSHR